MADSETFNPYHKWLGIPPKDQPPNHYRLLGLETFESDSDVISSAADSRMAHVRGYQSGKFGPLSQRILNELAAARVCLLNPEKKLNYDSQLRQRQSAAKLPSGKSIPEAGSASAGHTSAGQIPSGMVSAKASQFGGVSAPASSRGSGEGSFDFQSTSQAGARPAAKTAVKRKKATNTQAIIGVCGLLAICLIIVVAVMLKPVDHGDETNVTQSSPTPGTATTAPEKDSARAKDGASPNALPSSDNTRVANNSNTGSPSNTNASDATSNHENKTDVAQPERMPNGDPLDPHVKTHHRHDHHDGAGDPGDDNRLVQNPNSGGPKSETPTTGNPVVDNSRTTERSVTGGSDNPPKNDSTDNSSHPATSNDPPNSADSKAAFKTKDELEKMVSSAASPGAFTTAAVEGLRSATQAMRSNDTETAKACVLLALKAARNAKNDPLTNKATLARLNLKSLLDDAGN